MGGWNQSQAHAQFVANISDFKMNIQAALEAPRFSKHTFDGCDVAMENRFNGKVREELAAKGHKIDLKGAFSGVMGGGQAVLRDFATGVNYGASDPRKDGQAVAEQPATRRKRVLDERFSTAEVCARVARERTQDFPNVGLPPFNQAKHYLSSSYGRLLVRCAQSLL